MQIKSVSLENFKAIRHSGVVRLKPLTVLIGHNGSGKALSTSGTKLHGLV